MVRLQDKSRPADEWTESPDVDGYTWELGPADPEAPADSDRDWWREATREEEADPDWDAMADEAEARDRIERGTLL